jgi:hypothetical protein
MNPDMSEMPLEGAAATNGSGPGLYVASDIKRFRRTKAEIERIKATIIDILRQDHPQTVRQVFYALTVRSVIKKAEIEYQRTVIRLLTDMREEGAIPFDYIADNTRWMRKPTTYTGIDQCLNATSKFYRRNLWAAMPMYVEVWCEKDALAGVLMEETEPYDVTPRSRSCIRPPRQSRQRESRRTSIISATSTPPVLMPPAISRPSFDVTLPALGYISNVPPSPASRSSSGTCRRARPR